MIFEDKFPSLTIFKTGVAPKFFDDGQEGFTVTQIEKGCLDKAKTKKIVEEWIHNLRSGDGDYKKVYVENMMMLFIQLGVVHPYEKLLLKDLNELGL